MRVWIAVVVWCVCSVPISVMLGYVIKKLRGEA